MTSLWRQRADDGPSPPVGTMVANAELVQLSFSTMNNYVWVSLGNAMKAKQSKANNLVEVSEWHKLFKTT